MLFLDIPKDSVAPAYLKRIQDQFKTSAFLKTGAFLQRKDPELKAELKDADAILASISTKVDKEIIDAAPNLKYVGVFSTAFNAVDAKYARSKGVVVCNLGGYSTEAVAEFTFAALFEHLRALEKAKEQARKEDYSFDKFMGVELKNRTLGVIGAGKIGSRIAEIGLGIGMKVIYFSRKNKPAIEKLGAQKKTLEEVLSESDFLALALALNKETQGIIAKDKINLIGEGAVLINIAPLPLLDQEAVMKRANEGKLTFIFDHSDDLKPEEAKKYLKTKNCVVYPPIAFRTEEATLTRLETFASNVENFVKGKPQNVVN